MNFVTKEPINNGWSSDKNTVLPMRTVKGQKKIVWRCINRLDFGKKYCHNSPTVEESILQRAVMRAIMETAQQNLGVLQTLKVHIGMGLQSEQTEDNSMNCKSE